MAPDPERLGPNLGTVIQAARDIAKMFPNDLDYELAKLQAWREVAMASVPFKVGDRVRLTRTFNDQPSGWWAYRECLVRGFPGSVSEIDIRPGREGRGPAQIFAMWSPERCWSVSEIGGKRQVHEATHRKTFMMWVADLEACPKNVLCPRSLVESS